MKFLTHSKKLKYSDQTDLSCRLRGDVMIQTIFSKTRLSLAKLLDASMNDREISIVHGKNGRRAASSAVLVLMVLVVSACTPVAPAMIPDGEYTISEDHGYGTGTLTMILDQGHFSVSTPDIGELANGGFASAGNKITFMEEVTSPKEKSMCGSKVTYSYLWTFDAQKGELHFMLDMDDCELRAFTNTGEHASQPWHLKTQDDG